MADKVKTEYPKRPSFFAHRFVRLMTKVCAANEMGPEAAWMCTIVASLEDSKRYTGAVNFWNGQLMPLCGFNSRKPFERARKNAVDAGWLHYESRGRSKPALYWVIIPPQYEGIPDGSCDESSNDALFDAPFEAPSGTQSGHIRDISGTQQGHIRDTTGASSLPNPNPNPKPSPGKRARFSKPSVEEVTQYCRTRSNNVNPQQFVDHYTSNGWKVGKNPMKDWKAAVHTWERNDYSSAEGVSSQEAEAAWAKVLAVIKQVSDRMQLPELTKIKATVPEPARSIMSEIGWSSLVQGRAIADVKKNFMTVYNRKSKSA